MTPEARQRITVALALTGKTRRDVAAALGTTPAYVSQVLTGRLAPTRVRRRQLAAALGEWLIEDAA